MPARAGARRDKWMPVGGINRVSRADDEQQHDCHFHKHNDIIDRRRFANTDHQQQRNNADDDDGWQIEDGGDLRSVGQRDQRAARC